MKREIGYYWVYGNKHMLANNWDIALWDLYSFWVDGIQYKESDFLQINEKQIKR